jgi:hypothetical protein
MLTTDAQERKATPIASGVLDYFPDALAEVARVSKVGNDQHNPGQPLHWDKSKSKDEADALVRHLLDRGKMDSDGTRHSAKVAWRALAMLQRELDAENGIIDGAPVTVEDECDHPGVCSKRGPFVSPDDGAEMPRRFRYVRTDKMRDDEHFDAVAASVRATIEAAEEEESYTEYEAGVINMDGCS